MLGKLNSFIQKNQIGLLSHTIFKKINSKWIKDLNETIKFLEENIICSSSWDNIFGDLSSQVRATKAKNKQMVLHQTKNFSIAKENINKTKR